VRHPNAPSYVPRKPAVTKPLDTAGRLGRNKRNKIRRFLGALHRERQFVPTAEKFVPLPFETNGAAGAEAVALFRGLVSRWKEMRHATESQVAIFHHKWRYRISTAIQVRNAEMMSDPGYVCSQPAAAAAAPPPPRRRSERIRVRAEV